MNAQQRTGLGVTVALHVLALAALLSYAPARDALLAAAPIMVSLITPPKAEEPKPAHPTDLPKPKPVHRHVKPVEAPPARVVAAPVEAPSPVVTPPPPAAPAAPPAAAAPAPVAVIPPDFNAAYLNNPRPEYPGMSKRLREQGKVVLRVHVTVAGSVDQIQVRASSGHQRLDDAALEAVRRWKFVPAKHGSESVAAWVLVPIPFELIGS